MRAYIFSALSPRLFMLLKCKCSTYKEALSVLRSKPVDCIIMDWDFAGGSKLGLVDEIRKGDAGNVDKEIPIVLCTAHTRINRIITARDSGVSEIVLKPIGPVHLLEKMMSACHKRRSFVLEAVYCGPDRRRKSVKYLGEERRGKAGLDQAQIDTVMDNK